MPRRLVRKKKTGAALAVKGPLHRTLKVLRGENSPRTKTHPRENEKGAPGRSSGVIPRDIWRGQKKGIVGTRKE